MPQTLNTRVTSLEESMRRAFIAIEALSEKEKKLDDVLVVLAEAQIATQQSMQETERRFQETDRRMDELVESQKQTEERFRQTDARIEKLVIAIGEMLRNRQ